MPITFTDPKEHLELLTGQLLVAAAITMQSKYKRNVSTSFPPASKEGEYPKWRTGTGREATGYEPEDPKSAGRGKSVKVGFSRAGDHMGILELFRHRKGLKDVAEELHSTLQQILDRIPKQ